jgi:hypothetical protein
MSHLTRVAAFAVVILITTAACSSGSTTESQTATAQTTPAAASSIAPSVAASEAPAPSVAIPSESAATAAFADITLKGKGKKVAKFDKPADTAAIATITHAGERNIIIDSVDASGDEIANLVNEIGKYKGTVLFDEHSGDNSVAMKIDADGAWTITIKPVTAARAWDPSTPLKGVGDDVVLVEPASSGLTTLDLTYKGKSNFIVDAFSADGSENLANEIGNFSGQVLLPEGTVLLQVVAHGGTWTATPG